mgnify:CR=1 FL=1
MSVFKKKLSLTSHGGTPTFINITEELRAAICESGIREGIAAVISPHTTCAVFFEEFVHDVDADGNEFLQNDLDNALQKIIPNQTGNTGTPARSTIAPLRAGRMPRHTCRAVTAPLSGTATPISRRLSSAHRRHSR